MKRVLDEAPEIKQLRDNIRRSVNALELCWSCQRICQCRHVLVDDGGPVWLCQECLRRLQSWQQKQPGALFWPSA